MKSGLILLSGFSFVLVLLVTMAPCGHAAAQELLDIGLCFANPDFAAQNSVDVYDQETIYLYHSFLGNGFVKNGEIMDIGLLGSNLIKEMIGSEFALQEMQKYRKYKIAGMVTNLVATGFGVTGLVLTFTDNDGERDWTFEVSSILIGAVCGVLAEGLNRLAVGSMNRAVWLYNRDVVSRHLRMWGR